ncbi:histidine triad (HIT) family protein [Geosporobacter subterraneus DSM 17957]|uniref:Histidine triad (HIT) family protein n=1 Tax=Geosporobacter subterraneus DSM 17957 TaxID=1121919 RepID=A0A1M6JIC7_9FIRM|nr:histidine triad nucleotide-binding protein [Geosporobacter subterraneus]SHJ46382.1 histidine triad (HIT) family protein [Geosporobacter subterraneus DSM 17957]
MSDCIFCKINSKEIPAKIVYEDERVLAFYDISPAAPVHILIIPKEHIASIDDVGEAHRDLLGHIHLIIKRIAEDLNINRDGYRIVNNCGDAGGQTVHHLHFHLLGGRQMKWPPG